MQINALTRARLHKLLDDLKLKEFDKEVNKLNLVK